MDIGDVSDAWRFGSFYELSRNQVFAEKTWFLKTTGFHIRAGQPAAKKTGGLAAVVLTQNLYPCIIPSQGRCNYERYR